MSSHRLSRAQKRPGFGCGAVGPVFISAWDAQADAERARLAGEAMRAVARAHDKFVVISIVGEGTPPPEGSVRQSITAVFDELEPQIAAVVNVIEGQGFRAATMRGVITGMGLVMRRSRPEKVCASVDEGARFIVSHLKDSVPAEAVVRAVLELRGNDD